MFRILKKEVLSPTITRMIVDAPDVARHAAPGMFIILRVDENGERIPLTISDYDSEKGTVTIIFQIVGATTIKLNSLNEGEFIQDFVGPLGNATHLSNVKKAIVIGGGLGVAIAFPQVKNLKNMGAEVTTIVGFRNKDLIVLYDELNNFSDELIIKTDDGSNGNKGFVTNALENILKKSTDYDVVIAVGPIPMMRAVAELTRPYKIKTIVSMNTIMIDGTGMCGGCRLNVGGKVKFACVDGPDFDAHEVDFDSAIARSAMFKKIERDDNCRMLQASEDIKLKSQAPQKRKINNQATKTPMPEQNPEERINNFDEVAKGYTKEMAINEALRCLQCKNSPCTKNCPVNVKIPEFINLIVNDNLPAAYKKIRETNSLPAVCGRVCPQETQCEAKCIRGIKGEPVAIGRLERFVADYALDHPDEIIEDLNVKQSKKKVAIVGGGPAGISCAGDLARKGYRVTIFEALHKVGGVLSYGIPEFRLPKTLVEKEINALKKLPVEIKTNRVIGKSMMIDELLQNGYDAVFVGSGAGLPRFMDIPGENLPGVYSANEFLTRINLMKAFKKDKTDTPLLISENTVVVGGGNVAMDAARCAKRAGAKNVYIVYRRSEAEMPARLEEIHHAKEEGIEFITLSNPVEIIANNEGFVQSVICIKMGLKEADETGRRKPYPIENSEFVIDAGTVIIAIGNSPNPLIKNTTPGIDTHSWGGIIINEETGETSKKGVFAGGDTVTGAATVILAMGAGKKAAAAIDNYLKNK